MVASKEQDCYYRIIVQPNVLVSICGKGRTFVVWCFKTSVKLDNKGTMNKKTMSPQMALGI